MEGDRRTWTLLGVPAAKAGKRLPAGYPASPAPPTSAAEGGSAAAHPVQREPEQSLFNFGFKRSKDTDKEKPGEGNQKEPTEVPCCTTPHNPNLNKNKKYDAEKRKRVFQSHWVESWPWLALKESQEGEGPKMFCTICQKYPTVAVSYSGSGRNAFLSGCDQLRIEPIRAHETSKAHMTCVSWHRQEMKEMALQSQTLRASTSNSSPPTEQPLIMQALQKLKERERRKLTILFNNAYLIAKQGKPLSDMEIICRAMKKAGVDIGENYTNREKASEFIRCEADILRQDIQKIVSNSRFICIIADGSTDNAIIEQETVLVRVVSDGKPYTLFADLVPLEHAHARGVLDGIAKGIQSPKRRRDAKEISRIIDENFAHFTDIKQIRWVSSKTRALAAMQQNLQTVVLHLGQVAAGSDDSAAKAKKYLSIVTSFTFIKNLYSLRDVLKPVSKLSEFFQSNELLLMHVPPAVEKCALTLVGLKSELGEYMQQFKKLYHPEEKKFGNISTDGWEIKLSGCCPPAATIQSDSEFIDSVVKYIDERFENFNSMPVQGFQAFDYTLWPESREELYKYGISDIEAIVQHFEVLFTTDERLAIVEEFCGLKTHMKSFQSKGIPVLPAYSTLLATKPPTLTNILKLVEMMFTVSVSTAEAERVFSAMNVIKNPLRTRLNQDILQDLMLLKIEGPNFEEYDPSRAIDLWLTTGGTKHVCGHKRPHLS
ncbi:hypothetical protein NDU88_002818 [Pleurodeles waltl]|uniref:HAT C-terminal dimerisation domain-containing protein n=1 Tax=Pleurodeles waltl TaxID=8319 RepID=A0AAV7UYG0_PLEWA|nr:hypothetical protein NDU88_002818 [Pleurodeles waltl]